MILAYLGALALTLVVEVPIYGHQLRAAPADPRHQGWLAGGAVNLASHPVAFLLIAPALLPVLGLTRALIALELFAWLGEVLLLWLALRSAPLRLALISLLANATSLLAGLILLSLTGGA